MEEDIEESESGNSYQHDSFTGTPAFKTNKISKFS
jgi:hypothetical protein